MHLMLYLFATRNAERKKQKTGCRARKRCKELIVDFEIESDVYFPICLLLFLFFILFLIFFPIPFMVLM